MHARLSAGGAASASTRVFIAGRIAVPGWCSGSTAAACARASLSASRPANARQTLRYLREREQVGSVYREALVPVTLLTGERPEVMALAFLVERAHPSYAGDLPLAEQAHVIRGGIGRSGNNIDYLASTLAHLAALGIRERPLERLQAIIGTFAARGPGDRHTRATAASMVRVFGRRPAHASAAQGGGPAALLLSHGADRARRVSRMDENCGPRRISGRGRPRGERCRPRPGRCADRTRSACRAWSCRRAGARALRRHRARRRAGGSRRD